MNSPTSFQVGPRVKYARERLNMTRETLAGLLGFKDRQSISDIENGKRAVKADELLELSDALDQEVEFFLDPFNVVAEAQYSWLAADDLPGEELDRFESSASSWVGVLHWLHQQEQREGADYDFLSLRMKESSTFEQAHYYGERLAGVLQLGLVPAASLAECLEAKLAIPVLFVDTSEKLPKHAISGAACQVDVFSAILVNRQESAARRNFNLAHELFHTLTWEALPPSHRESNSVEHHARLKRVEQLANNFASALLMPRKSLEHFIDPARAQDVQHLADVADQLQVSTDALGWRLLHLGRIDEQTRAALAAQRRPDQQATPNLFSMSFVQKLHVALNKGRVSARKVAKAMGMPLSALTDLFEVYGMPVPFEL